MTHRTVQIAPNVWSVITYEESWKSYINNYVIKNKDQFLLIDTNLRKHRNQFQQELQYLGAVADRIEQVYCTHRHPDHIGNVELFSSRNNWIHLHDYYELDDFSQTLFGHTFTGSSGEVPYLEYQLLPTHTRGSVAFFEPMNKICFVGDHLCFYGAPLGEGFGYEAGARTSYLSSIEEWKTREPHQVDGFAKGLEAFLRWPIEVLATGHGPILQGDIPIFLKQVLKQLIS
ncbi:MBL fold metallo-hydrolase [Brevibacillus ginsengisoli]|uniref:MBL fold metallo-hydrolase n=1 Tax=Brevibacillus ginsengisoli TaxID=363854 RepID=UPI003CF40C08